MGVLTAVVMKGDIFWDIAPCGPHMNRRFGGNIATRLLSSHLLALWFLEEWRLLGCYAVWLL
jgi:hypothetical protein